jgi:hypothetical protein
MRTTIVLPLIACGIIGATLLGCGGDSPGITDPPGGQDTTTKKPTPPSKTAMVNALLAEITNGQSAASQSASAGGVPGAPAPKSSAALASTAVTATGDDAAACVLDATTKRFNCPNQVQPNGLTTTVYFQLLDATGAAQTEFDTLTTTSVRRVTHKFGVYSNPLITQTGPVPAIDTTDNTDSLALSAVRTPGAHKLNGTGLMKVVIVPEGQPVVRITAPTVTTDLAFGDSTKHYPISGTITATLTSIRTGSPASTNSQVTSFDGTSIAKLVITLPNGQKRTCTYDMTAPNVPAVCVGP